MFFTSSMGGISCNWTAMLKRFNDFVGAALIIAGSFYFIACAGEAPDEGPIDSDQEEQEAMAEDDTEGEE